MPSITASALPGVGGNIQQAYRGRGPCPFSRTLLGPLVHSDFDLNSITCTIIEIKT